MTFNSYFSETVYTTTEKSTKIPVNVRKSQNAPADLVESIADESGTTTQAEPTAPQNNGPSVREGELTADIQRLQAEYVNYRKRVERDRLVAGELAIQSTIEKIIPVLDDITAARKFGDLTDGPFASIANKLESVMDNLGLERINDVDVEFDPTIHDGVLRQSSGDIAEGNVSVVLREGYKRGERIIRPAQVMISAGV
jgi:molecular chaperone GrpE